MKTLAKDNTCQGIDEKAIKNVYLSGKVGYREFRKTGPSSEI